MQKKEVTLTAQIAKMVETKIMRDRVFFIVGIFASIAIALGCVHIFTNLFINVIVDIPYKNVNESNEIVAQLISMQANTLAIVSVFLTASATILGFLGLSQWKQTKRLQKQYEDMNHRVQNLFSLAVVQALSEEQYYIRANMVLAEELERLRNTSDFDNGTLLFSNIQMLLAVEKEAAITSKANTFTETAAFTEAEKSAWESVADLCTQILRIPYAYSSIRYLVQIKYIYAKWQLCRIIRQTDRKQALVYINDAHQMLQRISESEMDPYGHIYNLRGLVMLWRCKCLENSCGYSEISKYAEQYSKSATLFEEAIREAKVMAPKEDHSEFQNHLGVAQINISRCSFFDYNKRKNFYCDWKKKMRKGLLAATKTYYDLVQKDNDYGKAYLNLANICCYCIRVLLESEEIYADCLSNLANVMNPQRKTLENTFLYAQQLLRIALVKEVKIPDVGYKMFEVLTLEQVVNTSREEKDISEDVPFLQEINKILEDVIKTSNISTDYLRCERKKDDDSKEYQSLVQIDKYQQIDEFLAAILKRYDVIGAHQSGVQALQSVELAGDKPVIGFLEPWRNYAYFRFKTSTDESKQEWRKAAKKLNSQLKKHRKLQAESWEKETGCR